jgi:hypothetical protein
VTEPSYTPQTWHDTPLTDTPIDSARLNVLEQGVKAATDRAKVSIRHDASQSLNPTQQAQAQSNLGVVASAPLDLLATSTTTAALTLGKIKPFNCTSAAITTTALPALSGLAIGSVYAVQKTDTTSNTLTVPLHAGDTTDAGSTSIVIAMRELLYLQVVSNPAGGGAKYWKATNSLKPLSASDTRYTTAAVPNAASIVVDRPSGVAEGASIITYGPSRGASTNATRIHYDRIKSRVASSFATNNCVAGFLSADSTSYMFGAMNATQSWNGSKALLRQNTAADASITAQGVGTWINRALYPNGFAGLFFTWPFGNDAMFDGSTAHNSTTAKARASAANALHAMLCMVRADTVINPGTVTLNTTNGSPTVTAPINAWYKGMQITAAGVPANTYVGTITSITTTATFKLSSSRTSQVDVNATATGSPSAFIGPAAAAGVTQVTGNTAFFGNNVLKTTTNADTITYVIWLNEARRMQWVTAGIDDAEYVATASAPLGGTGGASYSVAVQKVDSAGANVSDPANGTVTGTTADQHRYTAIGGGMQIGLCFGQLAVDLGVLSAGMWKVTITNTGATGKVLLDDCLLVESLTPMTCMVMKEVPLPAGYYATATAVTNNASEARRLVYNGLIDTELALWPNDKTVLVLDVAADTVNGTFDNSLHISQQDGAFAHFNDAGERLVTDKIMGVLNALPARNGLCRI